MYLSPSSGEGSQQSLVWHVELHTTPDCLHPTRIFSVSGINFAGPNSVKSGTIIKQSYIVFFLHVPRLQMYTDLSTGRFYFGFAVMCR